MRCIDPTILKVVRALGLQCPRRQSLDGAPRSLSIATGKTDQCSLASSENLTR